jgi:hypothetical protein
MCSRKASVNSALYEKELVDPCYILFFDLLNGKNNTNFQLLGRGMLQLHPRHSLVGTPLVKGLSFK